MNKIYDEWYSGFSDTIGSMSENELFNYTHSLLSSGKNTFSANHRIMEKVIDPSWVEAIEEGILHIDKVLRNPRKTIEDVEEIVPIALSKKITVESVKHLAQHTDLIQEYDEKTGRITPSKVLNIYKEESWLTYENKFVNTLIDRLWIFINRRYESLSSVSKDEEVNIINYTAAVSDSDGRKMNVSLSIETCDSLETRNTSGLTLWERVEKIKRTLESYKGSIFCQKMGRAYIRPPVMRTNAIMKNVDLKACLTLWQFITGYDNVGYEINISDTSQKPDETYAKDLYNLTALNFLLFRSYTDREGNTFKNIKTRKNKPIVPKVVTKFEDKNADDYNIVIGRKTASGVVADSEDSSWQEDNEQLLAEIDSVIALEKEYIRLEEIRNEEKRLAAERAEQKRLEEERRRQEEELRRLEELRKEAERKAEEERIAREKAEAEEAERLKKEWEARQEQERIERERAEKEEAERIEREKIEAAERIQQEKDRLRRAELTQQRLEQERLAAEEAEKNLTPEEIARREQEAKEKAEREKREALRAERLRAKRAVYESRDFRTIYLEYSRSPLPLARRFFINLWCVVFKIPYTPDVLPKEYYYAEHKENGWFERLIETKQEHDERILMNTMYSKYSPDFPYKQIRDYKNFKWKLTHKKVFTPEEKEKIRKSLPVRTPEEEAEHRKQIRALFREYHVSVPERIRRNIKKYIENLKLKDVRVEENEQNIQ